MSSVYLFRRSDGIGCGRRARAAAAGQTQVNEPRRRPVRRRITGNRGCRLRRSRRHAGRLVRHADRRQ